VVERAVTRAQALSGKPRHTIAPIKRQLYAPVLEQLAPASRTTATPADR